MSLDPLPTHTHTHTQEVIEVSKCYLPKLAVGFSSPKVKVHIQDGTEFMQQCAGQFDVIITDSSDPIGEDIAALASYLKSLGTRLMRKEIRVRRKGRKGGKRD